MPNSKKLVSLDVLRGIACFMVCINHIRVATHYFDASKYDFIQVFTAWGREAVVIFFLLSGVVINLSSQNSTDRWLYFKKRFIRIYPIYLAVLIICFSADYFIMGNPINPKILIGNLLLSSGDIVPTMPLDRAVWSISCEAFFYLIFGLIYTFNRLKYIWIWFGISCLSIAAHVLFVYRSDAYDQSFFLLGNSFLWILGYLIFEYRLQLRTTLPVVIFGILMIPLITRLHELPVRIFELRYIAEGIYLIPLFVYLLMNFYKKDEKVAHNRRFAIKPVYLLFLYPVNVWLLWQYSGSLPVSKIIYSILPLTSFIFYHPLAVSALKWVYSKIIPFFTWLADISYPVYLLHTPMMSIMYFLLPGQKFTGMAIAIVSTLVLSHIFEVYLFKKLAVFTKKPVPIKMPAGEPIT